MMRHALPVALWVFAASTLPVQAQQGGTGNVPVSAPPSTPVGVNPTMTAPAPAPAYYYPPPGNSLQGPMTAAEVCRALRAGLSGPEVVQDVRERGFLGSMNADEAADARAAGAGPELVAALQAGRFTVSPGYTQRRAEAAAGTPARTTAAPTTTNGSGRRRGRSTASSRAPDPGLTPQQQEAERVAANFRARQEAEEADHRRLADLAARNERAIAIKEAADQRRFEKMKDRADWESSRRERHNTNGYLYGGRWYPY